MDHLRTDEERKARWYSKQWPRFVPVKPAVDWRELMLVPSKGYDFVTSLPFDWLEHKPENIPQDVIAGALESHGFLVVSSVLSQKECKEAIGLAWDWIETASVAEKSLQSKQVTDPPVRRSDLSTYYSPFFPRSVEGGMMPFYGSGHSAFAWKIRSHPNVRLVFESLYGTSDLISSLDGIVLWRAGHRTDRGWFHLDQNPLVKPSRECVQGLVNLLPVSRYTGGNAIVARSHKLFPQHYLEQNDNSCSDFYHQRLEELAGDDWMEIDPNDETALDPAKLISVQLKPGDLLLWDSRTVHCSYPAKADSPEPDTPGLIRAATTVCFLPTARATKQVLLDRKQAVQASRTLTHWANKVAPLGEERPVEVALESTCVQFMKKWQTTRSHKVLLEYSDLTRDQRRLVVGDFLSEDAS